MDILDLSIREMRQALEEGRTTPKELLEKALERAKKDDCNAFESILEKEAYEALEGLGKNSGPLYGIPYLTKDNFSVKGIETVASSNILKGYRPLYDATVTRKLKEAGAVLIGQTTMDELAMGGTGMSGHLGYTYNPYDPSHKRMVGGSSSGSAAAMAEAVVPFATGSDTGDSVRRPASLAGLVGVKPTWGRISRYGLFPFAPSLDHVGYFTRYVEDAALLLGVLAGHDPHDMTSSHRPIEDYTAYLDGNIKGKTFVRILDIEESLSDKRLLEALDRLSEELIKRGAVIRKERFGKDLLESLYATYIVISCAEATSNDANLDGIKFGPYYEGKTYDEAMRKARTAGFGELIKRRFVIGSFALMKENQDVLFLRAQRNRAKVVARLNELLALGDALLIPAASGVAPEFEAGGDKLSDEYLIADNHLVLGNFGGLPSISLPLAFENGLPLGVSLTLAPFKEGEMFRLASVIEDITGLRGLSVLNRKEGNL